MKIFVLIICFLISVWISSSSEDPESKPWRCRGSPFAKKRPRGRASIARPDFAQVDQQPFVPYNILYLIDDGIDQDDRAKLKMATDKANEKLSKSIKARKLTDVQFHNLDPNCADMCDNITFPEEFMAPCPLPNEYEPPNEIKKLNEANYTLVVRVLVNKQSILANKSIEGGCIGDTAAFALPCELTNNEGPHHGYFVFCEKPSSRTDEEVRVLVLHETLHILMPFSLGGDGANNHDCDDCKDITWKEVTRQALNEHMEPVEYTAGIVIRPFVQKAAQDHFGCNTVEGAELNFDVTDRSAMETEIDQAHWSQHLFPDEILAPYDGTGRFSNLTLSALASHEKWYVVDQSQAEPLAYSEPCEEFGCDVAHKTCFEILREHRRNVEVKVIRPYCDFEHGADRVITSHCSLDHQRQLSCVRHLSNTRCPFLTGTKYMYDNEVCAKATSVTPGSLAAVVGASFGPGTICVTTTSFPPWQEDKTNALCVHHECQMNSLIIKPNANNDPRCNITCTKSQSNQLLAVNWCSTSTTHRVTIICPDYEQVCKKEATTSATTSTVRKTTATTPASTTTSTTATTPTTSTTTATVPATTPTKSRITTASTTATTKVTTTTWSSTTTQKTTTTGTTATASRSSKGATAGRETSSTPRIPRTSTAAQASSSQVSVSKFLSASVTAGASVRILSSNTLVHIAGFGL